MVRVIANRDPRLIINMWCRRIIYALNKRSCARCAGHADALSFQDVPSTKGLPLVGTTFAFLAAGGSSRLHEYVDKRHKQLGPIFIDKIGSTKAVFLSDPEMMRSVFAQEGKYPLHIKPEPWVVYNEKHNYIRGLFFMDGKKWLHYRRIMNKLLLKGDLSWIDDACEVASEPILRRLRFYSEKDCEFPELEKELYKWSLDVLTSVLVGAETYKQTFETLDPLVENVASTVRLIFETTSKLYLIRATLAAKLNIPQWKRFEDSVTAALKSASDMVVYLNENFPNGDGLLHKMNDEQVEKEESHRIVADLILGGADTTTYTMEWMLYLIGKHKEAQERLREGDKVFLRNVLRETLRLYPVTTFLNRFLPSDGVIGGYHIPAGTLVVMSIYTSGRDEKHFKDALKFYPDRWLRSTDSTYRVQQASLPFAIGVRSCVGKKIAEAQLQTALWQIVRNFDVEVCNDGDVDIIMNMVAKPEVPIRLKFNKI